MVQTLQLSHTLVLQEILNDGRIAPFLWNYPCSDFSVNAYSNFRDIKIYLYLAVPV